MCYRGFDAEDGLAGSTRDFFRQGRLSKWGGTSMAGKSRGRPELVLAGENVLLNLNVLIKDVHIFISLSHITFWGFFPKTQLFFSCDIGISAKKH